ncbi:hypothetical protein B484DRAFT_424271 [Ochromonadaceae sp. CCMP2298]|nr:hypothetical protein B484DRAFT_424271 [Ochromonadaceae sp. CCMP2298]
MFRATRPLRQVSRMPSRMQRQRPFVMFIVPIVLVGIGAFFAITLGQVVRRRMLENKAEKEEAKDKDKEKETAPVEEVIFSIIRSGRNWFTCITELFHLHGDTLGQFFEIASFNICNGLIVINNILLRKASSSSDSILHVIEVSA